jgi:hypothetical protein
MGQIGTPRELFFAKLGDILYVEQALEETLPRLADEASDEELRKGLEHHLEQTRGHTRNVEEVFRMLGESPEPKECAGFEGLKAEHEEMAGEVEIACWTRWSPGPPRQRSTTRSRPTSRSSRRLARSASPMPSGSSRRT